MRFADCAYPLLRCQIRFKLSSLDRRPVRRALQSRPIHGHYGGTCAELSESPQRHAKHPIRFQLGLFGLNWTTVRDHHHRRGVSSTGTTSTVTAWRTMPGSSARPGGALARVRGVTNFNGACSRPSPGRRRRRAPTDHAAVLHRRIVPRCIPIVAAKQAPRDRPLHQRPFALRRLCALGFAPSGNVGASRSWSNER